MNIRETVRTDLLAMADLPYDGEEVDQLAHALQAGTLAAAADGRPALVAAALLHDVGRLPHVEAALPAAPHERAGAAYVTALLGAEVGWLVGSHVLAKRALVATDPDYFALLSPTSVRTLAEQGGPAAGDEVERFLHHRLAADAMQLRRWDDQAKDRAARPMPIDDLLDAALG
ncbi:MAG TPA: HD domain-containing protein [Pseudonocardia sp.]|jgi:predicted HD phosphohydrolase|nr:HD domain-containing protein [Pseudonocardia sp.]